MCPRVVKKARLTLLSLEVREGLGRDKPSFHPQQLMNSSTASFTKSCPVTMLGCHGDIWVA